MDTLPATAGKRTPPLSTHNRLQVAAPIPQPQGYKAVEGYKIMFSVAGKS